MSPLLPYFVAGMMALRRVGYRLMTALLIGVVATVVAWMVSGNSSVVPSSSSPGMVGSVVAILDGDTLDVRLDTGVVRVRILGIG